MSKYPVRVGMEAVVEPQQVDAVHDEAPPLAATALRCVPLLVLVTVAIPPMRVPTCLGLRRHHHVLGTAGALSVRPNPRQDRRRPDAVRWIVAEHGGAVPAASRAPIEVVLADR